MQTQIFETVRLIAAILIGSLIGLAFGKIQNAALRRHAKLQARGEFKTGWDATPGSFRRVGYLLVALALVQFLCPMLFAVGGARQWCVSAGVVLGYGWILYVQLRRRLA